MKAKTTLIAAAIAALLPLGVTVAGDNDQYGKEKDKTSSMQDSSFQKLDTNSDGRISQAEAAADSSIVFNSADSNGDGYLDSKEWKASTKGNMDKTQTPQSMPSGEPGDTPPTDSTPPTETTPPTDTTPPPDTETPRQ